MAFKEVEPDTVYLVSLDGETWEHKTWREIQERINPKQELYYDDLKIVCLRCGSPLYNTVKGAECRNCGYIVPPEDEKRDETLFPEEEAVGGSHEYDSVYDVYDKVDVNDWFKRCKADFPEGDPITHSAVQSLVFYQWFEKWFSQFIEEEKSEEAS